MGASLDEHAQNWGPDAASRRHPLRQAGEADGQVWSRKLDPLYTFYSGIGRPIACKLGGGAATGTAGDRNQILIPNTNFYMEMFVEGTQTIIVPVPVATGLDITLDATDNDGHQWVVGGLGVGSSSAFVIGTHAFFYEAEFTLTDISGTDFFGIYVRKNEVFTATFTNYLDYAFLGVVANAGLLRSYTDLNDSGTPTSTSTGITWADGERKKLRIEVALTGAVTFSVNGVVVGATNFVFDTGDTVVCGGRLLHASDVAESTILHRCEAGLLYPYKATLP